MSTEKMNSRMDSDIEKRLIQDAKVGATAGWTVRAAADNWMSTVAASQTNATLIVPLSGLKNKDKIVGYHLLGQIESVGGTASIAAKIGKSTPVAAGSTHADVAGTSLAALSVTAQTALTKLNTKKTLANEILVSEDNTYYMVLTATTALATDIELLGVVLYVRPER